MHLSGGTSHITNGLQTSSIVLGGFDEGASEAAPHPSALVSEAMSSGEVLAADLFIFHQQ